MTSFEAQDGVAFFLISYTQREEFYYLTLRQLKKFWERSLEGGRKSFRYEELDPRFFFHSKGPLLIPYLDLLQLDLDTRD